MNAAFAGAIIGAALGTLTAWMLHVAAYPARVQRLPIVALFAASASSAMLLLCWLFPGCLK